VISIFLSATMAMAVLAGPLCGAILQHMDGIDGLHGWQWLFLIQGPPACILGVILYFYLQDKPADAHWLTEEEKSRLAHNLKYEVKKIVAKESATLGQMLSDRKVYALALVYFMIHGATYLFVFWMPTVIQHLGVKDVMQVGLYSALPYVAGFAGMILFGISSDKYGERRWHLLVAASIGVVGLVASLLLDGHLVGSLSALAFALFGLGGLPPLLFALVSDYLPPAVAAGGIALISSLGNLGSAASPAVAGVITQHTGNQSVSIYMVAIMLAIAIAVVMVSVRTKPAR